MNRKYDVISFGSAALDIFIRTNDFLVRKEPKFINKRGLCFPFGLKNRIEKLEVSSGGGGTNVAATFVNHGLNTAYCGVMGNDWAGNEVFHELQRRGIDTSLITRIENIQTNTSVIFSLSNDRTIFISRSASQYLNKKNIPWKKLKTDWIYLAPLSGKLLNIFGPLVEFAFRNKIKIMANLGIGQLKLNKRSLKLLLDKIDIVLLNQEEASLLTSVPYTAEKKLFNHLDEIIKGLAIMTKGKKGVIASDGEYIWKAKSLLAKKIIEKTGTGDAFGAGFLVEIIKGKDVSSALQFGIANAHSCLGALGAKNGLLKKNQCFKKVKIIKKKL